MKIVSFLLEAIVNCKASIVCVGKNITNEQLVNSLVGGDSNLRDPTDISGEIYSKDVYNKEVGTNETPKLIEENVPVWQLLDEEQEKFVQAEAWDDSNTFIPGKDTIRVLARDVNGNMIVSIGDDGAIATIKGSAGITILEVQTMFGNPDDIAHATVNANGGTAKIEGQAHLSIEPLDGEFELILEGGGVLGASIGVDGGVNLNYLQVNGGVEAIVGLALQGSVEAEFEDWKFEFEAGAKLSVGVGAGGKIGFEIDGKKIGHGAVQVGKAIGQGATQAGQVVEQGVEQIGAGINKVDEELYNQFYKKPIDNAIQRIINKY